MRLSRDEVDPEVGLIPVVPDTLKAMKTNMIDHGID